VNKRRLISTLSYQVDLAGYGPVGILPPAPMARTEHAVGPGREGLVPAAPGETDALFDETGAQTQHASFGFDQKESELGDLIAGLDNEDATDPLAPGSPSFRCRSPSTSSSTSSFAHIQVGQRRKTPRASRALCAEPGRSLT
jgi:hypothetical protein